MFSIINGTGISVAFFQILWTSHRVQQEKANGIGIDHPGAMFEVCYKCNIGASDRFKGIFAHVSVSPCRKISVQSQ